MAATFDAYFAQVYPGVVRTMWLACGSRLEGEDLAQEAMARVFERWEKVRRHPDPAAYTYRVAFNLHRRRMRRLGVGARAAEKVASAAQSQAGLEERVEILDALSRLPLAQRQAVVLVEWLGYDAAGAGEILGITASSVRSRTSRARNELRLQLGGTDG